MKISNWKAVNKGSLRGSFFVTLPSGLVLHDCALFEKDDPMDWNAAQRFTDKNGGSSFKCLIDFTSHQVSDNFAARYSSLWKGSG